MNMSRLRVTGLLAICVTVVFVFGAVAMGGGDPPISAATRANAPTISSPACGENQAANHARTLSSGAEIFVGVAAGGAYCLAFRDSNGATVSTSAAVGDTPVGRAVALRALDTGTGSYVTVVALPDGFGSVVGDGKSFAIENNVTVLPGSGLGVLGVDGSAGHAELDLRELAG